MVAKTPKQIIVFDNVVLKYSNKAKILGLNFKSKNFFKDQVDKNIHKTKFESSNLFKFRYLNLKNKTRLYKSKVLSHLIFASVPLNFCS